MVDVVVEVVVVVVGGGLWKGGACEERLGCSRSSAAKPNYRLGTTLGALQPKNGGVCQDCVRDDCRLQIRGTANPLGLRSAGMRKREVPK